MEKARILIVDDVPDNIRILAALLGDAYKLTIATESQRGLALARQKPDLILLDVMMPEPDGYEVCRLLKADPETSSIPIIFITAKSDVKDEARGIGLGAVDYIVKPFCPHVVLARVDTHLTVHRLRREIERRNRELEGELANVAHEQRLILPDPLPSIPGLRLAAHYETSRYAGGDYYDVFPINDGRWAFMIADASGHSTPAAVLIAMTCALLRSYQGDHGDPEAVMCFLNQQLRRFCHKRFVTAIYGVYDPADRCFTFASAGHPSPLHYVAARDQTMELPLDGVAPLGIFPISSIQLQRVALAGGDRLLLFTDGITEPIDAGGEPFGVERLAAGLAETARSGVERPPARIIELLTDHVGPGQPEDDRGLLLLIVD